MLFRSQVDRVEHQSGVEVREEHDEREVEDVQVPGQVLRGGGAGDDEFRLDPTTAGGTITLQGGETGEDLTDPSNNPAGRIGDAPILGAGTWADQRVAVSCTGTGEAFMRCAAAHEIAALMRLAGKSLEEAANEVALLRVPEAGGRGGLIAVDAAGNAALPFGTEGMYRGLWRAGAPPETAIHAT